MVFETVWERGPFIHSSCEIENSGLKSFRKAFPGYRGGRKVYECLVIALYFNKDGQLLMLKVKSILIHIPKPVPEKLCRNVFLSLSLFIFK